MDYSGKDMDFYDPLWYNAIDSKARGQEREGYDRV